MGYLVPLYTVTLFISAFLLFSVQPMVGKYLLPLLGGGPSVWNTAMLFFQLLLLGGYAYAHGMAHFLKPRTQYYIHIALFLLAAVSLPLVLPEGANPTGSNPMLWQLGTMILMAAGPFFILSSTAPLLQQWFAKTRHEKAENPYFLYVASNIGSMLALLSYPIIIEPLLRLYDQSIAWSFGYGLLGLLLLTCGLVSKFSTQTGAELAADAEDEVMTWKRRGAWLLLAFVPSSLMLGVTTFITTDVTTVPLFWVIPLALYLLTFIIAFSEKPFLTLPLTRIIQALTAMFLLFLTVVSEMMLVWNVAIIHLVFFFFTALMCHQELAALRPKAKRLTEFYLIMSLGGALGGIFNSFLAPLIFVLPIEYMILILLSLFCRYLSEPSQTPGLSWNSMTGSFKNLRTMDWKIPLILVLSIAAVLFDNTIIAFICGLIIPALCFNYQAKRWVFAYLFVFVMVFNPLISWKSLTESITIARNYYGVILVSDKMDVRFMTHGVTNHGGQALDPEKKFKPFGYYNPNSGLGDTFKTDYMKDTSPKEIAIVGLGTGSVACYYNGQGRHFDYFEIDPEVVKIAENPEYFTFLSGCGVDYDMHVGDGRLMMETMPDNHYDMIMIDAFTSDNIPLHIISKEATEIYLRKLKPDGILLFHVSNRFFRLDRELGSIAKSVGRIGITKIDRGENDIPDGVKTNFRNYGNYYVVLTGNQEIADNLVKIDKEWRPITFDETMQPWTDDYANILRALIVQ